MSDCLTDTDTITSGPAGRIAAAGPDLAASGLGGSVQVDLGAVAENWRVLTRLVGPGCQVAAAVKADGYGLGMVPVARALAEAGCRWFFVALPAEAEALLSVLSGFGDARIAVLSGPPHQAPAPGILPVLNDLEQIATWRSMAPGRPAVLHVDTGMARLGLMRAEVMQLAAQTDLLDRTPIAAVISHLACADEPDSPMNARQREDFLTLAALLPKAPRSLAASCGSFLGAPYHFDMVRVGAALFGINPTPGRPNPMQPVVKLQARILQVRTIADAETVGYGASWRANGPRRIATLGVGYADGILRAAGSAAECRIGPHAAPLVGRISMDLITADVTDVPAPWAEPGALAELIGPHYPVDALARDCQTIGYEILTRLGPRLPRVYVNGVA